MCRLYCVLESFLILWALALALDAIFPCLFGDSVSKVCCPASGHAMVLPASSCTSCTAADSAAGFGSGILQHT